MGVVNMISIIIGWCTLIFALFIFGGIGFKDRYIQPGIILFFSGILIAVGGSNYSFDNPDLYPGMALLGFLGLIVGVAMFAIESKRNHVLNKEIAQRQAEVIGATMLDRFFVECVLMEANDFSKQKNIQKAQLLAEKYNLEYQNGIEELYQQGLNKHKAVSQRLILNRIEEKRAEELEVFNVLNKYSDFIGKDKRIAMLSDIADKLRKKAKSQDYYADMLIRSGQQKERNWATWGGIAEGIAGVGAGVSTAVDIQMKNMQIRAENEKHLQAALPSYMFTTRSAEVNHKNADSIMKEIENFKLKLISDEPATELMKMISFNNTDVSVSETGAAMICTFASLDPKFRIFDDVSAVVDGTIIAEIYDGNQLCGTAQLVLPLYGLGQNIPLKGICINCCKPGKNYTVEFVPKNLWAMEK